MRTVAERFWAKVQKGDGCWLWTRARHSNGYGVLQVDGRPVRAHRLSWELLNGRVPAGLSVLHRCDVRHCVNPAHLFLGTNADNVADMVSKGRRADFSGDRNGNTRLTDRQVVAIARDSRISRLVAVEYGVSAGYVRQIRSGANRRPPKRETA